MHEKRKFPRFPVKKQVVCFRYGKEMVMRTLDISLGGLKLEAPFDLGVGESMVHARVRFDRTSDIDSRKLSNCFRTPSRKPVQQRVIGDSVSLLQRGMRHAMTKGVNWGRNVFGESQKDKKLQQVNSWLELLPDIEKTVITLRFGLNGEEALSLESIGKRFGLTPERIRQIEAEAVEKLRKINKKKEIYLDDII
jgi:RNA polymerase sigma factor (sigma-70 family)